ncbi:cytochrome P450 [Paenibacillus sp. TRM 82003]|uniref:cytochrome P450 n=1 Tax=Kineococcus sp. TRM81007 TaxID=2925831 RepID=UPI001F59886D|nr:cytochrome P450 [Kineococcus sp. TRM81007]MCI2240129.1 cytochrome P450 [Kineococcus sp. TRM81007]MCI3925565.1 cytochrome P450 [Paenibacillus sp. TRM 82003]
MSAVDTLGAVAEPVVREARLALRWGLQHGLPRLAVRRGARGGDLQSLLLADAATWREPYAFHERVRAAGPLLTGRFTAMTAWHATVREVLGSADFGVGSVHEVPVPQLRPLAAWTERNRPVHPVEPPSMLAVDPPEHTRYRRLVSKVFSARAVEGLRPRVGQLAAELLDEMAARGPVADVVHDYVLRLPVAVIAEVLGVPAHRREEVRAFGAGVAGSLEVASPWRQHRAVETSLRAFDAWIGEHLEHLRRHPGDDLLSGLLAVTDDEGGGGDVGGAGGGGGARLSDRELRATAGLLMAAGFETTVNLLGSATALLLEHPDQLALAHADAALWPGVVEESLRLEAPVQLTSRRALRDTAVAEQPVDAGRRVVLLLGAAGRDPRVFTDPARFDVRRANAREHLAFSGGRHFCLGAALARLEGEVGLRALFERFPDLRPAPGARRTTTRVLRGWERLPVRLT